MNRFKLLISLLSVVTVTLMVLLSGIVYAKDNIDVVLAIDSSGSMKKTDPMSLRIPAAKLFISLLDEDDRAAVLSFSENTETLLGFTQVNSAENKDALFEAAEQISSDGMYTNLFEAMNQGYQMLGGEKDSERSKIVVLMSDGMMDVGDPAEDQRLLESIKSELMSKMKTRDVKVYTIAFTDQSDRKLLEKVSKRTGGFYNTALSDKDLHLIFTNIFESLKTPDMLPMADNGFTIDNSINEVTIVATKEKPTTKIKINAPKGRTYSADYKGEDIKWFESNKFDMVTVTKPLEGKWEILFSTGKNNKAYIITDLKLQTNFDKLYTTYGKSLDIKIWLEKEGKTLSEKEVLDTINVYMEVTKPDKKIMKLKPFNKGEGIFLRRLAPFKAGNYTMKIIAKGKTFEREKTFVFNVADVQESKEDIQIEREEKKQKEADKKEESAEQEEVVPAVEDEPVEWGSAIVQFVIINIILGLIILGYLKREKIGGLIKSRKSAATSEPVEAIEIKDSEERIEEKKKEETKEAAGPDEAPNFDEIIESAGEAEELGAQDDEPVAEGAEEVVPEKGGSTIELEDEEESLTEESEDQGAEELQEESAVEEVDVPVEKEEVSEEPEPEAVSVPEEPVSEDDWAEALKEQEATEMEQAGGEEEAESAPEVAEERGEAETEKEPEPEVESVPEEPVSEDDWAEALKEQEASESEQGVGGEEAEASPEAAKEPGEADVEATEPEEPVSEDDWAEALKEQEASESEQGVGGEEAEASPEAAEEPGEADVEATEPEEPVSEDDWAEALKEQEQGETETGEEKSDGQEDADDKD